MKQLFTKNNILSPQEAIKKSKDLQTEGKRIVLVGGCFDILHIGHILFLENAKKHGDILMVLLESDEAVQILKGQKRPINTQEDRAAILSSLATVNIVIVLPKRQTNEEYDLLVWQIKPAIIATTKNDPGNAHKKRQAEILGIPVIEVIDQVRKQSTSRIASLLEEEFVL